MSTSLDIKIRTAAALDSTLSGLLGSTPFRWFGPQSPQGSTQPLVEVQQISQTPMYSNASLLITCPYRMQFTIWDTNLERARSVRNAIIQFLTTFNAYSPASSVSPLRPNKVLNVRLGQSEPQTDPITWWITLDAMIFNNENT